MKVLSLFDGISCGRVAFDVAGIPVTEYHACEIDKYATQISQKNYPDIIRHGSVTEYHPDRAFDYLIGGSPCQGFSFAGKQLAFDDPRSALFFEFVRIWKECKALNPNIKFLLENVRMKKEYLDIISENMGVQPVCINSNLVSAQNRVRYYWTNWSVPQPKDKGILLKDILEHGEFDRHVLSQKALSRAERSRYSKPRILPEKTGTINPNNNSCRLCFDSGTTLIPTCVIKDRGQLKIRNEKAMCLDANYFKGADNHGQRTLVLDPNKTYRKLTPVECERLQTLPDGYTEGVSDTQRYKGLGNGWTVDVIAHILRSSMSS